MVAVPGATAATVVVAAVPLAVATPLLLLLHAPPVVLTVYTVEEPTQIDVAPDTDAFAQYITDILSIAGIPIGPAPLFTCVNTSLTLCPAHGVKSSGPTSV